MSEDSLDKQDTQSKGWGVPGAIFLGSVAYFLPAILIGLFVPSLQTLPISINVANFISSVVFEVMIIGAIYIFVRGYGLRFRDLGLVSFKLSQLGLVAFGFGVYFVASVVISTITSLVIKYDQEQVQDIGFVDPVGIEVLMVFMVLVVLAPLAEELLFRGFMFNGLRRKLPFWVTSVLVSLLFALIHGQINVALDVFALSLVLCWLRERTGSLWPAIILHAAKNLMAFLLLFVFKIA